MPTSLSRRAAAFVQDERPAPARFFRDEAGLRVLAERLAGLAAGPLRVWTASGSVGEDAYSLAIALLERLGRRADLRVFATTPSAEAVAKARRGFYAFDSLSGRVDDRRLDLFFTCEAGGCRIVPTLRQLCVFSAHDAARDPQFGHMDAVYCPLPLSSLPPLAAETLLRRFHFALKPGGLLLLADPAFVPAADSFRRAGAGAALYSRVDFSVSLDRARLLEVINRSAEALRSEWRGGKGDDRLEARRRQEELIAMVSHELRTPLAAIIGSVDTLSAGVEDPRRNRCFLKMIDKNARRLLRTVDGLMGALDERRPPKPETVKLRRAASEAARSARAQAKRAGVSIHVVVPGDLMARFDPEDLPHVLENLIGNAVKYNRRGGRVRVSASAHDGCVALSVEDTGPGIPPEALPRVFDRFYRSPSTRHVKGSGLGLSIVRDLVEANGGQVQAASSFGHGATFTLLLPKA